MPAVLPSPGSAVNATSYTICGTWEWDIESLIPGFVIPITCLAYTQQFQYIIVQTLDSQPQQLCIAELAVHAAGKLSLHCLS